MTVPVLPSTFVLTALLGIGLFFFIKASVKDRIQQERLIAQQEAKSLFTQLQAYFSSRAYQVVQTNPAENQITYEGFVRPSWFLAIFLTLLAAVGFLCLALVLSMLVDNHGEWFLGLVILSPLTGLFYWQRAKRMEQVSLKLETTTDSSSQPQSIILVRGHRDELATLKQSLGLKPLDSSH
ncbi:MAG: cofactor assembly of complex C subunit B [Cyanobacteria bacterium J06592_8]